MEFMGRPWFHHAPHASLVEELEACLVNGSFCIGNQICVISFRLIFCSSSHELPKILSRIDLFRIQIFNGLDIGDWLESLQVG